MNILKVLHYCAKLNTFTLFSFYNSSYILFFLLPAPCPLITFLPTVDCTTNVVSVAWNDSVPGVTYVVSAIDATGQRQNCSGTDSGCELSTLDCGTHYNVTITPVRNGCMGIDSPTTMITTGADQ